MIFTHLAVFVNQSHVLATGKAPNTISLPDKAKHLRHVYSLAVRLQVNVVSPITVQVQGYLLVQGYPCVCMTTVRGDLAEFRLGKAGKVPHKD